MSAQMDLAYADLAGCAPRALSGTNIPTTWRCTLVPCGVVLVLSVFSRKKKADITSKSLATTYKEFMYLTDKTPLLVSSKY